MFVQQPHNSDKMWCYYVPGPTPDHSQTVAGEHRFPITASKNEIAYHRTSSVHHLKVLQENI